MGDETRRPKAAPHGIVPHWSEAIWRLVMFGIALATIPAFYIELAKDRISWTVGRVTASSIDIPTDT